MTGEIRSDPLRWFALALWVILAMAFNFTLGIFEGHDEASHFLVASRIADERALPHLDAKAISDAHEVTQPPLYYVFAAIAIAPFDRSDLADEKFLNPRPADGLAYDHTRDEMRLPPTGAILAIRAARSASVLFGALTLLLIASTATVLIGAPRLGTLAMILAGFNPKFLHVFSVVSNDTAVFACSALFVWAAVRASRPGHKTGDRELFAMGAIVGLAVLSKYNGAALALPAGALVLARWSNHKTLKRLVFDGILLSAGFLAVTGGFLIRNQVEYGNPVALDLVELSNRGSLRPAPLDAFAVFTLLSRQLTTYFDSIGRGLIPPVLTSFVAAAVLAVGSAVFINRAFRKRSDLGPWLCLLTVVAGLISWAAWSARYDQTGNIRLSGVAFPALALISGTGAAWLLASLLDRVRYRAADWAVLIVMGTLATATVTFAILPSYDFRPGRVPSSEVRALAKGGEVRFDNGIEILSVDISRNKINSGERANLTFYWRSVDWRINAQVFVLEARDASGATMARLSTNPVPGLNTTTWGVRTVYSTTHGLVLTATKDTVAQLYAGFYDYNSPYTISRVIDGGPASALIGQVKVRAGRTPDVPITRRIDAIFGNGLRLEGFEVVSNTVTLSWRPDQELAVNEVIFLHALDERGQILGQSDALPDYAMPLWDTGEQVREVRVVPGLAGATALRIGVYEPLTRQRLPARDASGAPLVDDVALVPLHP